MVIIWLQLPSSFERYSTFLPTAWSVAIVPIQLFSLAWLVIILPAGGQSISEKRFSCTFLCMTDLTLWMTVYTQYLVVSIESKLAPCNLVDVSPKIWSRILSRSRAALSNWWCSVVHATSITSNCGYVFKSMLRRMVCMDKKGRSCYFKSAWRSFLSLLLFSVSMIYANEKYLLVSIFQDIQIVPCVSWFRWTHEHKIYCWPAESAQGAVPAVFQSKDFWCLKRSCGKYSLSIASADLVPDSNFDRCERCKGSVSWWTHAFRGKFWRWWASIAWLARFSQMFTELCNVSTASCALCCCRIWFSSWS